MRLAPNLAMWGAAGLGALFVFGGGSKSSSLFFGSFIISTDFLVLITVPLFRQDGILALF